MENIIIKILRNKVLLSALTAQLSSQLFKVFKPFFKKGKPNFKNINAYGGFPSAHTAFISSATLSLGLESGFSSPVFGFATVVCAIIISDIIVVRNYLYKNILNTKEIFKHLNLKESEHTEKFKNHTTLDIITGVIWGCLVSIVFNIVWK
ncbi:MAG: divergent PAP2 family protein [Brevinematales bacterium]|nr:divergent PAP2 family protein [Brevinematales bacterium]